MDRDPHTFAPRAREDLDQLPMDYLEAEYPEEYRRRLIHGFGWTYYGPWYCPGRQRNGLARSLHRNFLTEDSLLRQN